eukprot:g17268.t1
MEQTEPARRGGRKEGLVKIQIKIHSLSLQVEICREQTGAEKARICKDNIKDQDVHFRFLGKTSNILLAGTYCSISGTCCTKQYLRTHVLIFSEKSWDPRVVPNFGWRTKWRTVLAGSKTEFRQLENPKFCTPSPYFEISESILVD